MSETLKKDKTYVHEGVVVVWTGRIAKRNITSRADTTIYEIKPADAENGSWLKWVRVVDLYEIQE